MENIIRKHFDEFTYTIGKTDITDKYIDIGLISDKCAFTKRKHARQINTNHIIVLENKLTLKCTNTNCKTFDMTKTITDEEYNIIKNNITIKDIPEHDQKRNQTHNQTHNQKRNQKQNNNANKEENVDPIDNISANVNNFIYILIPDITQVHSKEIKIGKTSSINSRFIGYSSNAMVIYLAQVKNCDISERWLIDMFSTKYLKSKGNEYFIGDVCDMVKTCHLVLEQKKQIINLSEDVYTFIINEYKDKRQFNLCNNISDNTFKNISEGKIKCILEDAKKILTKAKQNDETYDTDTINNMPTDIKKYDELYFVYTRDDIRLLLSFLSHDRRTTKNLWINVAECLFNIHNAYYVLWLEWTENYQDTDDCYKTWQIFLKCGTSENCDIKKLLQLAKIDSPEKYDNFIKAKLRTAILPEKYIGTLLFYNNLKIFDDDELNDNVIIGLNNNDMYNISRAISIFTNDKLYFVDNDWYLFTSGKMWEKQKRIEDVICGYTVDLYKKVTEYINKNKLGGNDLTRMRYVDQINNFVSSTKQKNNIKTIISYLEYLLKKNISFDCNHNLFAFTNGVYDFSQMAFRQINKDDMITINCGYEYKPEYANKQSVMDLLDGIFITDENRDKDRNKNLFLTCLSRAIRGYDNNIMLLINSINHIYRNQLLHLLNIAFGNYICIVNDLSFFEQKEDGKMLIDLKTVMTKRILVAKNIDNINDNEIVSLVQDKSISYEKTNTIIEYVNINFFTLCFSENDINYTGNYKERLMTIKSSNKKHNNIEKANKCDLFLMLVEHIKNNNDDIKKVLAKYDDEYYCLAFIKDCAIRGKYVKGHIEGKKYRVVSSDVYERYEKWYAEKDYGGGKKKYLRKELINNITKYNTDIKYKKSTRVSDKIISCLEGIKLK